MHDAIVLPHQHRSEPEPGRRRAATAIGEPIEHGGELAVEPAEAVLLDTVHDHGAGAGRR